tara:strand:- start:207 stop:776 length:570 start_codon:yes stop_codon:yes gene_type:complete
MANNFWTNAPTKDPKRGFRFRVQIPGIDPNYLWYAKQATKPTITFGEASHSYLNHTYYWPGRAEWNEVDVTLVDPIEPALAGNMAALVEAAGYQIPRNSNDFSTMSKASSIEPLGKIIIEQIDEEGNGIETWTLNNAWVKELTWGELSYESDDLIECTIKLRYDWAALTALSDNGLGPAGGPYFAGPSS